MDFRNQFKESFKQHYQKMKSMSQTQIKSYMTEYNVAYKYPIDPTDAAKNVSIKEANFLTTIGKIWTDSTPEERTNYARSLMKKGYDRKTAYEMTKKKFGQDSLNEVAPSGIEAEKWIKANKDNFKKQYGNKWEEVLYATAWKMFGESKNINAPQIKPHIETIKEVAPDSPEAEEWIKSNKKEFQKRYGKRWKRVLYGKAWKMFGESDKSDTLVDGEYYENGRKYKTYVFPNDNAANKFLKSNPSYGVIGVVGKLGNETVDMSGDVHVAEIKDEGEPFNPTVKITTDGHEGKIEIPLSKVCKLFSLDSTALMSKLSDNGIYNFPYKGKNRTITLLHGTVLSEGVWKLPTKMDMAKNLFKLFEKPITASMILDDHVIYNLIGDDDLYDTLEWYKKNDPTLDVRPIVATYLGNSVQEFMRNPYSFNPPYEDEVIYYLVDNIIEPHSTKWNGLKESYQLDITPNGMDVIFEGEYVGTIYRISDNFIVDQYENKKFKTLKESISLLLREMK